jgi:hypothetical protein
MAYKLPAGNNQAHAFMSLAKYTPNPFRMKIVREGLLNTRLIDDRYLRSLAFVSLFSQLSPEEKMHEFEGVMAEINKIGYVLHRGEVIHKLAPHMCEHAQQFFELGVNLISMTLDEGFRIMGLLNVIEELPDSLNRKVFRNCFEQILNRTAPFTGMNMARLIEKSAALWEKNDLVAAFQLSIGLSDYHDKVCLLEALVPLAVRFDRDDIVTLATTEILAQSDKASQAGGLTKIIPYVMNADKRCDLINKALEAANGISPQTNRANLLTELLPILSGSQRETIWHLTENAVLQADNNYGLLKNLSDICFDEDEKKRLLNAAVTSALKAIPPNIIFVLEVSVLLPGSDSLQLQAFDLLTEQTGVSRDMILRAIDCAAPAFASIGGTNLVRQIMHDISENAEWWP